MFSIVKAASRYQGETDFSMENGMFVTRILLNLPEELVTGEPVKEKTTEGKSK